MVTMDISTILDKVDTSGDCWEWTGSKFVSGYGRIKMNGETYRAHRLVYALYYGEMPTLVRHTCDNRGCVRPSHLQEGSNLSNTADMITRGRAAWQNKTHCVRGHEWMPENWYHNKRGDKTCRLCKNERNRAHRSR